MNGLIEILRKGSNLGRSKKSERKNSDLFDLNALIFSLEGQKQKTICTETCPTGNRHFMNFFDPKVGHLPS